MIRRFSRGSSAWFLAGSSALFATSLQAAGYAIAEQSISGLGYGFAGAAAIAEDASTIWHNPAGMAFLSGQPEFSGGLHFILPSAEFRNTGSLTYDPSGITGSTWVPTQGPNDSSDSPAVVPNLFYAHPVSEDISLGLAVNAPFGLRTSYESGWVGRYTALETDLRTVNINPSVSVRLSDQFALGFGVSYMKADAVLSNAVDFGLVMLPNLLGSAIGNDIIANRGASKYDGVGRLEGDADGYGFNLGLIWQPAPGTRVGLHYRSAVKLDLEGTASFRYPTGFDAALQAGGFIEQGGKVDLKLPSNFALSVYHEVTDRLALLGDVTWTDWSQFQELYVHYQGPLGGTAVERSIPENWQDTWRFSAGARYVLDETWALRCGIVWDGAAVRDPEHRSPRIPDADRLWLTAGVQWQIGGGFAVDLSYAHIFVDNAETNNSSHSAGQVLIGDNEATVDILSVGGLFRF